MKTPPSPMSGPASARLDHLVIAASSLEEGVAWCEATLGVVPGPGGEHPLMGTHNRLLNLSSARYPQLYLEIIAINLEAPYARGTGAGRWFDLENNNLQAKLATLGPRLVHFVTRTPHAADGVQALKRLALDRGELITASRTTANGLLEWKITVRSDGQRLFYGALPTLIEWGQVHPTDHMPASGITLESLQVSHPRPQELGAAYAELGLEGIHLMAGPPNIVCVLNTPAGSVTLESKGI